MDGGAVPDPRAVAALDASRRLERGRCSALAQALAEKRRLRATQAAASLARIVSGSEKPPEGPAEPPGAQEKGDWR